jgi:hypothetical protein
MKNKIIYSLLIAGFLAIGFATVKASGHESLWECLKRIPEDPWFTATIVDFYNNQLIIYGFIFLHEKGTKARLGWLFGCIAFGSFASILYVFRYWRSRQ